MLKRLGAGGMGHVFLGQSPGGRLVAVKVIRPELAREPGFRRRFAREVAAARNVSGLFTALVADADPDADVPWLATAYVAGPSLAEAVDEHGPLPVASVVGLAAGLAEGLSAIHAAGVVHRDLKPSNGSRRPAGDRLRDLPGGGGHRADPVRHGHRLPWISFSRAGGRPGGRAAERHLQPRRGPRVRRHRCRAVRRRADASPGVPGGEPPARHQWCPRGTATGDRALLGQGSRRTAYRRRPPGRTGRQGTHAALAARPRRGRPDPVPRAHPGRCPGRWQYADRGGVHGDRRRGPRAAALCPRQAGAGPPAAAPGRGGRRHWWLAAAAAIVLAAASTTIALSLATGGHDDQATRNLSAQDPVASTAASRSPAARSRSAAATATTHTAASHPAARKSATAAAGASAPAKHTSGSGTQPTTPAVAPPAPAPVTVITTVAAPVTTTPPPPPPARCPACSATC